MSRFVVAADAPYQTCHRKARTRSHETRRHFVNVARAHLVDEEALYEHCRANADFVAGIDVWGRNRHGREETSRFASRFPGSAERPGSPHNSNSAEDGFAEASIAAAGNVACF
jgi:phosphoglycerate dehydrogenase-like enzyme